MDSTRINALYERLQSLCAYNPALPIPIKEVFYIREGLESVSQQISNINPSVSQHLIDLKNVLFTEMANQQFYLNQAVYGQTLEAVLVVIGQIYNVNQESCKDLCHLLHPTIHKVSGKLYKDGNYAEAACNAFIEINSRLKGIYCEKYPDSEDVPDGQKLMNRVFGDKNPVLVAGDMATETGKDIQAGTRYMFAGAMAALRNPKSHENITLRREDCMRRLIFARMLMYIIDETSADD